MYFKSDFKSNKEILYKNPHLNTVNFSVLHTEKFNFFLKFVLWRVEGGVNRWSERSRY